MVKRRGLITTIVLITLLAGINIFLFFNGGEISYNTVSGRLIEELPHETPCKLKFIEVVNKK